MIEDVNVSNGIEVDRSPKWRPTLAVFVKGRYVCIGRVREGATAKAMVRKKVMEKERRSKSKRFVEKVETFSISKNGCRS
jgi:hypothetical protein